MHQEAGSGNRTLAARVLRAIGTARLDDGSGKSDTCKECSSCAVPDGVPDASRTKSDDADATPYYDRKNNNPGSELAFEGATITQLFRMTELMNLGRIPNIMIPIVTNNVSRRSDEEEAQWEFTTLWPKFNSRNAAQMILMDIEHELRAMDQARLNTDGIHFDSVEGQAWMNRVFQQRLADWKSRSLTRER